MNDSPWSSYGRVPPRTDGGSTDSAKNPVAGVVNEMQRGREKLEQYLQGVMREISEIQFGEAGYRTIIADAMTPSSRPETIEERLNRLAREAQLRRPAQRARRPQSR